MKRLEMIRSAVTFAARKVKNLFNIYEFISFFTPYWGVAPSFEIFDGERCAKIYGSINADGRAPVFMENEFKANTSYVFSTDVYDVLTSGKAGMYLRFIYTDNSIVELLPTESRENEIWKHYTAVSNSSKTLKGIMVSYGTGMAYSYIKNIRLEEIK